MSDSDYTSNSPRQSELFLKNRILGSYELSELSHKLCSEDKKSKYHPSIELIENLKENFNSSFEFLHLP